MHQVRSLRRVHILCVFYTCTVQFSCVYVASDNVEINENTTTATTTDGLILAINRPIRHDYTTACRQAYYTVQAVILWGV